MKSLNKNKKIVLALLLFGMLALTPAIRAATISTDLEDYAPDEVVIITGIGFNTSSVISVVITGPDEWGFDTFNNEDSPWYVYWYFDDPNVDFKIGYLKEKCEGTFSVTVTDSFGNTATTTFTDSVSSVDITGPTTGSPVTVTSLPADVTISFNYSTSNNGTTRGYAWVGSIASWENPKTLTNGSSKSASMVVTIPFGTANGSYTVSVTVTNAAGGSTDSSKTDSEVGAVIVNVSGDETPPETYIDSGPDNPTDSKNATFEFSANESECTFECRLDGGGWSPCTSPKSYNNLSDGTSHTFEVRAIDASENTDPTPAIYTWMINANMVDTTLLKPTLSDTSIALGDSVTVSGTLVVGTGGALAGHTIRLNVSIDGGTMSFTGMTATTDSSGYYTFDYTPSAAGSYVFQTQMVPGGGGNSGYHEANSPDSDTLNVISDTTAPIVNVSFPSFDGLNGWFVTSPVSGTVTATDPSGVMGISVAGAALSDVTGLGTTTATGTLTVDAEGINNVVATAIDSLGNTGAGTGSINTAEIKIDTIPPTIFGAPTTPPNEYGWYNTDVVVHFTADDLTSGIDTVTPDQTLSLEGVDQFVTGTAFDIAGNSASYKVEGINIDKTAPIITAGTATGTVGNNGWWRSPVTVPFSATDNLSGFATEGALSIDMASKTTSGEGFALYVTSDNISDMAGNLATGIEVGLFDVDWTPPVITVTFPDTGNGAGVYLIGEEVDASWSATDNLSGVVLPDNGTLPIDTSSLGTCILVIPACLAEDEAGNPSLEDSTTYEYSVKYGFNGLLSPYKTPDKKSFKINSSIPLKWQYTNYSGMPLNSADAAPLVWIWYGSPTTIESDEGTIDLEDAGNSGYQYDSLTNTWQFNWKTKGLTAGIYTICIKCGSTGQIDGPFPIQLR